MGTLALIGLGSNLGDRKATLDAAIATLSEGPGTILRATSSYHETAPVGGPGGQGAFLNGAAAVETDLPPEEFLRLLHRIEQRSGRTRTVRWSERTLDLDLLLFGDQVIESAPVFNRIFGGLSVPLQVPHPRMALRRFVLAPLAEIAPAAIDPLTGRSVVELLVNLDRRPGQVTIHQRLTADKPHPFAKDLYQTLVATLPADGLTHEAQREELRRQLLLMEFLAGQGSDQSGRIAQKRDKCRKLWKAWFERQCHDLDLERCRGEFRDDRWLVSDFWLDANYGIAKSLEDEPTPFLERLLEARSRVLAPTFVVVPVGCRRGLSRVGRGWPPPFGDVPILEIKTDDPPEVIAAEVLAACRATRTGG